MTKIHTKNKIDLHLKFQNKEILGKLIFNNNLQIPGKTTIKNIGNTIKINHSIMNNMQDNEC